MDFLSVVLGLLFLNALAATSCFAFFTALGNYWVQRPAPRCLSGAGLHFHRFFDGLEYSCTRSAMAISMARNLLVLKCLKKDTGTKAAAASPVISPPMPSLPEILQKAMQISTQVSSSAPSGIQDYDATATATAMITTTTNPDSTPTPKVARSRSRITPPKATA